ncbi:ATP-dependent RNA helicase DDX54 [Papilio machaon]|uniref:RNA helicase n=1 Tax=Papilio machaon TaxID=76193 RepID=A0A194QKB4_PAPMA|nr:ATP-dependent RNA helicase DDX54 [Papilio machaon]
MLKPKDLVDNLPGFEAAEKNETTEKEAHENKKKKKGSGGFQSMGLSFPVIKGITKRGYKQPTPIQRKTIPIALEGKDVVAMARTGSGKTACFVLPILEKLLSPSHKAQPGKNLRALILSPTRELALQTLRFVRELGKFTGLTSAAILGGESIEQQFSVMSGKAPDIVVATPGRFLHICIEMSLKLDNIKVMVFDEADRLFELGFGEQLREIVARLPSSRQTLLFSATMPKMLVEFARAGLTDPVLIRLDVDWKLPSTLWLAWISVRAELKTAALLMLLDRVLTPTSPQAVVFAATKHHVEYLHLILQQAGITSTFAYSGLDPSARKIALGKFTNKKCSVLLVTDVAARGLDLPALDTVINYNFPAKPKLFVHRVAAGPATVLGAELLPPGNEYGNSSPSGVWGAMPTAQLELRQQDVLAWEKNHSEIEEAVRVCERGWQQYVRWRESASAEANRRAKTTPAPVAPHPYLVDCAAGDQAVDMVEKIKNYMPKGVDNVLEDTTNVKSAKISQNQPKKKRKEVVRDENYIPHFASDQHTESGMAVNFAAGAVGAELELGADSGEAVRRQRSQLRWDRKRKKMVHVDPDGGRKMIRTESGGRVPASFRSGRYEDWKKRNAQHDDDDDDDDNSAQQNRMRPASEFRPHWVKHNERVAKKKSEASSKEFRNKQQIVKERLRKEKIKLKLKHKMKNKKKKRK